MTDDEINKHAEKVLVTLLTGAEPGQTLSFHDAMTTLESVIAGAVMVCAVEGREDSVFTGVINEAGIKLMRLKSQPDLVVILRTLTDGTPQ